MKKAGAISTGLFNSTRLELNATLTQLPSRKCLLYFRDDTADAAAGEADGMRGALGEVEHAAANERSAIVDGDDDAAAAVSDLQLGAERQGAVGGGHGVLIEALAGGGLVAGLVAVIGRDPRETAAAGRADRRIGVEPGILGFVLVVMMMVVAAVMPGFSCCWRDASADQERGGDQGDGRT